MKEKHRRVRLFMEWDSSTTVSKRGKKRKKEKENPDELIQSFSARLSERAREGERRRGKRGKSKSAQKESELTVFRVRDRRSVQMCAYLSFCPLLRLSTAALSAGRENLPN